MSTRYRYRRPIRAFLYIHGSDVFSCVLAFTLVAITGLDYALQPHGVTRFVVAVIQALAS